MVNFFLPKSGRDQKYSLALPAWVILVFSLLTVPGCGDLFSVENPNSLLEEDLDDPGLIPTLGNTAEGALSQPYDWAVNQGSLPGDGLTSVTTNQGSIRPDRGIFEGVNEFTAELWNQLASARWTSTEATRRLENLVDNPESNLRLARSYYWDGVARITLADLFEEVPFDGGPPQTPAEVYEGAIERLKRASEIAQAAPEEESVKFVAVSYATIARAYRSLYFERDNDMSAFSKAAEFAQKALDASPDFSIAIRYQTPGSENGLFSSLNQSQTRTIGPAYANLRDPVSGERDPRIDHSAPQGVGVRGDSIYAQYKYDNQNADIPVSRWQEAELILAEYDLLQGQGSLDQAVEHINRVRTHVGLPSFASDNAQEIKNQIIYERKAEFWLELRRWQDMRYYGIVPEKWIDSSVEKGVNRRFHVSQREQDANPNY
jgi:tetratricopeptide (TPR) repeat protein